MHSVSIHENWPLQMLKNIDTLCSDRSDIALARINLCKHLLDSHLNPSHVMRCLKRLALSGGSGFVPRDQSCRESMWLAIPYCTAIVEAGMARNLKVFNESEHLHKLWQHAFGNNDQDCGKTPPLVRIAYKRLIS